jgi:crotonobetainyl-CoA:carnitine CoA-transferase CaiB-like acyl-CoA transferase
MSSQLPLRGVRVLAVEVYGAGPYGTAHLADMGAEVIKIENRAMGGDTSRIVGPYNYGADDSPFFQSMNRNKKSLTLDLKSDDGRAVFERLAATADGVFCNLRGDQGTKLRLKYGDLAEVNPRIVCAHLSAYGSSGSRASWPGYDYLIQSECGFLSVTGEPDGPPARFGLSMIDFMTGMTTAFAFVSALLAARETGRGRDVETSLYDVGAHQLSYPAVWYLNEGLVTTRQPRSAHPNIVPSQLYRTADGWLFIMAQTQKFWELLCHEVDRPDWIEDPAYRDLDARLASRDKLTELLDEILSTKPTAAWVAQFGGKVPCAPVYDIASALDNPFLAERGGIDHFDHPDDPDLKMVASPIRIGAEIPKRPAPKLGADTDALLSELGFDAGQIATLRDAGVI